LPGSRVAEVAGGHLLVGDGDSAAGGLALLEFVHQGDGEVLGAESALAVGVGEQLVATQAVGTGALARV
jgi:hypothetical protein